MYHTNSKYHLNKISHDTWNYYQNLVWWTIIWISLIPISENQEGQSFKNTEMLPNPNHLLDTGREDTLMRKKKILEKKLQSVIFPPRYTSFNEPQ